jgi:hypothetical protein
MSKILARGLSAAFLLCAGSAAAENPQGAFRLWSGLRQDATGFFTVDVDPATPGIETVAVAFSCKASTPDANGFITVQQTQKIVAKSADGTKTVFNPATTLAVTSGKFPDPRLAQFRCSGTTPTSYETTYESLDHANYSGCPEASGEELCVDFPFGFGYGFGVAQKNGTRVIISGNGMNGAYEQPPGSDGVRIGKYAFGAWSLDGTRLWSKTLAPLDAQGFAVFPDWAMVGQFLGDQTDQVRIVSTKSGTGGAFIFKYTYYDVLTGAVIRTVTVNPSSP